MSVGVAVPRSISAARPTRTASVNDVHHGCLVLFGSSRSRSTSVGAHGQRSRPAAGGCPPRAIQISSVGGSPSTRGARISVRVCIRPRDRDLPVGAGDRRKRARQPRRRARRRPRRRASRHARCPAADSRLAPPAARHIASTASSSNADGTSSWFVIDTASGTTRTRMRQRGAASASADEARLQPDRAAARRSAERSCPTPPSRMSPRIRTRRGALTVSRGEVGAVGRGARLLARR